MNEDRGRETRAVQSDARDYLTEQLPGLLQILQNSDVCELEVQEGDVQIRLHRAHAFDIEAVVENGVELELVLPTGPVPLPIRSPLVGTFYRAGQPGTPPLVAEGSHVEPGTVVGIIEALHVLTDVEAGRAGVVTKVLATDGQPVEYGQVLFEVTGSEP